MKGHRVGRRKFLSGIARSTAVFQASNQLHGIKNAGAGPATYHVINWSSPGMLKKNAG